MIDEDDLAMWMHSQRRISIVELEHSSGLTQDVLRELVDLGALTPEDPGAGEWHFAADCVARLRAATRITRDLELETPALALALSFLERIERLQARLRELEARQPRPPR